jgi:hypothetical protein
LKAARKEYKNGLEIIHTLDTIGSKREADETTKTICM